MEFIKHIPKIEKKIGYTFKDKSLLTQAFTRSSFCNEHKVRGGRQKAEKKYCFSFCLENMW